MEQNLALIFEFLMNHGIDLEKSDKCLKIKKILHGLQSNISVYINRLKVVAIFNNSGLPNSVTRKIFQTHGFHFLGPNKARLILETKIESPQQFFMNISKISSQLLNLISNFDDVLIEYQNIRENIFAKFQINPSYQEKCRIPQNNFIYTVNQENYTKIVGAYPHRFKEFKIFFMHCRDGKILIEAFVEDSGKLHKIFQETVNEINPKIFKNFVKKISYNEIKMKMIDTNLETDDLSLSIK